MITANHSLTTAYDPQACVPQSVIPAKAGTPLPDLSALEVHRDKSVNPCISKLPKFEKSSGNVFADLGLPNADELLLTAQIVTEISRLMKLKKLTQAKTATLCNVAQPDLSNLLTENSEATPSSA
jgi:predicted XRE-type DNA-binding protein